MRVGEKWSSSSRKKETGAVCVDSLPSQDFALINVSDTILKDLHESNHLNLIIMSPLR